MTVARACKTCCRTFPARGKARYCSDACRCGTDDGYYGGCRCEGCTRAHARHRTLSRLYPSPWVPVLGTRRRVEGLAYLGWSAAEVSRRLGYHRDYLAKTLTHPTVEAATAERVARLYDQLSMTVCPSPTSARTAARARSLGYAPPLAWDEGALDDPAAHAHRPARDEACDPVVVDRILAGEWRLASTAAERVEVVARWRAAGRSLTELERRTGWNGRRYYDIDSEVA